MSATAVSGLVDERADIRVVVAAGPTMVSDALTARLAKEDHFLAISVPGEITAVAKDLASLAPRVIVVDFTLTTENPESIIKRLRCLSSSPEIVVLVKSGEENRVAGYLDAGVAGLVLTAAPSSDLVEAIRWAAQAMTWISPPLLLGVISQLRQSTPAQHNEELRNLTPRELEVLSLLVEGFSRREIANELFLSIDTVRTHIGTVLKKLQVHSAVAAAAVGRQAGLRHGDRSSRP